MAANFQLLSKQTNDPVNLVQVDKNIAKELNLPFDDKFWCCNWFTELGLGLALGETFDEQIDIYRPTGSSPNKDLLRIVCYLDTLYIPTHRFN